jgi:hypothetical protein
MANFDEITIAGLVEAFYEAAMRPALWRPFLAQMAMTFDAEDCGMTPGPGAPYQPVCSPSMNEIAEFGLRGRWYEQNPGMTRGVKHFYASKDVVTEAMLFTPRELDWLPFHAEFVNRFGLRHFAGLVVSGNASTGLAFSLARLESQGPFSAVELDALRRLVPHIQGAGRLAFQMANARQEGALDTFPAFDCGALLLDWRRRVTRVNAKAETLMGPWLSIRNGAVVATDRDCDAALRRRIGVITSKWPREDGNPADLVAVPRPPARSLVVPNRTSTKSHDCAGSASERSVRRSKAFLQRPTRGAEPSSSHCFCASRPFRNARARSPGAVSSESRARALVHRVESPGRQEIAPDSKAGAYSRRSNPLDSSDENMLQGVSRDSPDEVSAPCLRSRSRAAS